ncbi:GGDEF domain-containing protein [Nitrincola sp. MINF-07-Sa-05]|uniref:GGDEF domain-containing protein n=1 Tax=Nitrincola salilacus TaxID=3400273 RepID=UPI003917F3B0
MQKKSTRPLTNILLTKIVAMAIFFAVAMGAVKSFQTYQAELSRFNQLAEAFSMAHVPLLMTELSNPESSAIEKNLWLLVVRPEIAAVVVETSSGQEFSAGYITALDQVNLVIDIPHPTIPEQHIGTLGVTYDTEYLHNSLIASISLELLELALFTALIYLLIRLVMERNLNKPLQQIAQYAATLSPKRHMHPLVITRPKRHWRDEIDLVIEGFNTLRTSLARYVDERDRAMEALANEKEQLDHRVIQRTEVIAHINEYLELLSRISVKLIDMPLLEFPAGLRKALYEIAHYHAANACAIANCKNGEAWTWRFIWRDESAIIDWAEGHPLPSPGKTRGWSVSYDRKLPNTLVCCFIGERDSFLLALHGMEEKARDPQERRLAQMTAEAFFKLTERWLSLNELEKSRRELLKLSNTDSLTDLANRRHFDEIRQLENRRAQRSGHPLSLLMLDVDFFKPYNDHYGHDKGDKVLQKLSSVMQEQCQRAGELVARIGGEEFAVLLPDQNEDNALAVAERIRQAIHELNLEHRFSFHYRVTISIGVATLAHIDQHTSQEEFDSILLRADRALYAAKNSGRNCVVRESDLVNSDAEADQAATSTKTL